MNPRTGGLVRGVLQVTLAMMAAASIFGWFIALGLIAGRRGSEWTPLLALGLLTGLYGLLGFAVGSVMTRRHGKQGMTTAVLGTMLAWAVIEFFFYLYRISSPQMRAPLIAAVPLSAIGGIVSLSRVRDREVGAQELEEELAATASDEDEAE